jgi:hypothetical protein
MIPSLHDRDISNMNDLGNFWAGKSSETQGPIALSPSAGPPLRVSSSNAPVSRRLKNQEVIVAVRYRLLDESFISLRHMRMLHLHYLPLVIPNPHPAEAASKTFSTLRLARAEFVLFTSFIALGAAPAIYRGLNFSFEHPMFAQMVAASIVSTIAYTAWSSRLKIEMAAKLLIEEATLSRVVSQDSQTALFVQEQYLDACSDATMLLYCVKLTMQRLRDFDHFVPGEVGNSGMDDDMMQFIRNCEELQLAESGSGLLVQPLQEKANNLLASWRLVGTSSQHDKNEDFLVGQQVCEVDRVEQVLGDRQCSD